MRTGDAGAALQLPISYPQSEAVASGTPCGFGLAVAESLWNSHGRFLYNFGSFRVYNTQLIRHGQACLIMTTRERLFSTVSDADRLKFWERNGLNYQKVRDFVGLDAKDVARATGVAKSSVRYDDKAPREVREHLENVANICNLVWTFFQDDVKTKLWLQTPNPLLGDLSPRDMIRFGRFNKLLRFVTQALDRGDVSGKAPRRSAASV